MTIITKSCATQLFRVNDNVEAVTLYSKVDGGTIYFLPPFLFHPFPFFPPLPTLPLEVTP